MIRMQIIALDIYKYTELALWKIQSALFCIGYFCVEKYERTFDSCIIDVEDQLKFRESIWTSFNITHPFTELEDLEDWY